MEYTVQPGDTIAGVTRRLGTDWTTLKDTNPEAIGKSARNGNWFLKAGATVSVQPTFQEVLMQETARHDAPQPSRVSAVFTAPSFPTPAGSLPPGHTDTGHTEHIPTPQTEAVAQNLLRKENQTVPDVILLQQTAKRAAPQPALVSSIYSAYSTSQMATSPPPPHIPTDLDERIHILQKGETIWELARNTYRADPDEIIRHNNISNPNTLQIGQRIRIPAGNGEQDDIQAKEVVASWYGHYHHGRIMANGAPFDMHGDTIAHKEMPFGTRVELENPHTGEKVEAVVTDRGPYIQGRDVDLSYGLAERLSLTQQGVGNLRMRIL
jgi:rare lipoprotein A (peptidoglycan hydrolase)